MINWFTVAAQIINFLILVALLKKFLYGPIIKAMDKREASIRERIRAAEKRRDEADHEAAEFRARTAELEEKRRELIDEARQEADTKQQEWLQEARDDIDRKRKQWQRALARDREGFLRKIRSTVGTEALDVARRALVQLADAELEARTADAFAAQLETLAADDKAAFEKALREADGALAVTSATELPDDRKRALDKTCRKHIDGIEAIAFDTDADLICGLEISAGGSKLGWSMRDLLDQVEDHIVPLLEQVTDEATDDRND